MRVISSRAYGLVRSGLRRAAPAVRWVRSLFATPTFGPATAGGGACRAEGLEARRLLSMVTTGVHEWLPIGPAPATGGQVRVDENDPVTGAVSAIGVDPHNPSHVYIGTVGAGMWRTTGGVSDSPDWQPLTSELPRAGITSISFDPVDSSAIYVGTGQVSSTGQLGGLGIGILKGTQGGTKWEVLTALHEGTDIFAVVATKVPQAAGRMVLFASQQGVFASEDGGLGKFRRVSEPGFPGDDGTPGTGLPDAQATDLIADPRNPTRLDTQQIFYAAVPSHGVYRTDDTGATWELVDTGLQGLTDASQIELDVSPAKVPGTDVHPVYTALIALIQSKFDGARAAGTDQIKLLDASRFEAGDRITIDRGTKRERAHIARIHNDGKTITLAEPLKKLHADNTGVSAGGRERPTGIFRSANVGDFTVVTPTWASMGLPTTTDKHWVDSDDDGTIDPGELIDQVHGTNPGGQAEHHFSMLADKTDPTVLWVGGDRQPVRDVDLNDDGDTDDPNEQRNAAGLDDFYGRLFRGDSDGNAWEQIVGTGADPDGAGPLQGTAPHADSRAMAFLGNDLLEADDAGIYRLVPHPDPATPSRRRWTSFIGNLSLTEFYSIALDPVTRMPLGGTQDVGTLQRHEGVDGPAWRTLSGGDGGYVEAVRDPAGGLDALLFYSNQELGGFVVANKQPDLVVLGTEIGGQLTTLHQFDEDVQFIQPFAVNANDSTRVLIGTGFAGVGFLYEGRLKVTVVDGNEVATLELRLLNGAPAVEGGEFAPPSAASVGQAASIVYGGFQDTGFGDLIPKPEVAWVGVRDQEKTSDLWVRQGAGSTRFRPVTSYPGVGVKSVAVDPLDWRHVYVLDEQGSIFFSANGGAAPDAPKTIWNWQALVELPAAALNELPGAGNLQTLMIYHRSLGEPVVVLVGGEGGVFRRIGNEGPWTRLGAGLPQVMVTDLDYDPGDPAVPNDDVLVAGTLGRGAWVFNNPDAVLTTRPKTTITGSDANDVFRLQRNKTNPLYVDVYEHRAVNTPPAEPTASFRWDIVERLEVFGLIGEDLFVIDTTNGALPFVGGVSIDGGSDNDRIRTLAGPKLHDSGKIEPGADAESGSHTMSVVDASGSVPVQEVRWTDVEFVEDPPQPGDTLDAVSSGLRGLLIGPRHTMTPGLADVRMPLFVGRSFGGWMNGVLIDAVSPKNDPFLPTSQAAADGVAQIDTGTSIFGRLFEEGAGAFRVGAVGAGGRINTPAALEAALDGLDDIPGNVRRIDHDGDGLLDLVFDVQVAKTLSGIVDIGFLAKMGALGDVELTGEIELGALVRLDVIFGMDDQGFFLRPKANSPAIRISHFAVSGDIDVAGRFGFLGVTVSDAAISVDDGVALDILLADPGTDAADGVIRPLELRDFAALVTPQLVSNPADADDDLVFTGTFGVGLVARGIGLSVPIVEASVRLAWDNFTQPSALELPAGAQSQPLLDFLSLAGDDVFAQLQQVGTQLQSVQSEFQFDLPFLSGDSELANVVDLVGAYTDRVLGALSDDAGNPVFETAQDLVGLLAGSIGIDLAADPMVSYDPATGDLAFHVPMRAEFDPESRQFVLAAPGASFGTVSADLAAAVTLDFTFGYNVKAADPAGTFFFQLNELSADVTAELNDLPPLSGSVGPFQASVAGWGGEFGAHVSVSVADGGPAGMSLDELAAAFGGADVLAHTRLLVGATNISGFVGSGGGGPGVSVTGANLALGLFGVFDSTAAAHRPVTFALDLSMPAGVGAIQFVGLGDLLTLSGRLAVEWNSSDVDAAVEEQIGTTGVGLNIPAGRRLAEVQGSLAVPDLVDFEGTFAFDLGAPATVAATDLAGGGVNVSVFKLGGSDISAFAGASENGQPAAGLLMQDVDFALALMRPTGAADNRRYYALRATAGSLSVLGFGDPSNAANPVRVSATGMSVEVNGALNVASSADVAALDLAATPISVLTGIGSSMSLAYGEELTRVSATVTLATDSFSVTTAMTGGVVDDEPLWLIHTLDVNIDGLVDVHAEDVEVHFEPASANQPVLSVGSATARFSLFAKEFTFSATGLNLRRNGEFEFTSATLAGNNLLALADFLPLSLSVVSLQGIDGAPAAFDAFRLSVDGQFSDTLFQNDLLDPVIQIGEVSNGTNQPPTPVLVEAGATFGIGVEVDGGAVRLLGPGGRRLGGFLTVGFEHLDLGGFEVDASLTLGGFTDGVYAFNAIGLSGAVRGRSGANNVGFDPDNNPQTAAVSEVGFGGNAVIEDAGNGNRRLRIQDAEVTTSFDTGPGGLAQLRVVSFAATFDFQWTLGPQFQFVGSSFNFVGASADDVFVRFGEAGNEVLLFHATGATFNFRDAGLPWMTFASMSASLPALEDLLVDDDTGQSITGTVSNFAIGRNLGFIPIASDDENERFGVVFDGIPSPESIGLPRWLPFRLEKIGLEFGERALSGEALDVILVVSAGFNTPEDLGELPIQFEASVSDMRVNLGVLADLFDPTAPDPTALDLLGAVSFGGFSIGIERIDIGGVVEIGGALALRTIDYPGDDGIAGNADDRKVLVGTIAGFFGMAGFSGGVELTISEVGPIVGKLDVPLGIPLGPTGLLLSGVSGGFRFGGSDLGGVLPQGEALLDLEPGAIAQALLGSGSGIFDPLHVTDNIIDAQIIDLVRARQFTWNLPFTLALSGEIATVASPGVLSGDVTLAVQVDLAGLADGEAPEIHFVGSGDVEVFGIPVGGVGALLDLSDPFNATYYLAAAVPLPGSFLSFLFPAQATLDMVVSTGGLFEAPIVGLRAFLEELTSPAAHAQLRASLQGLLGAVIDSLRDGPPRPATALLLPLLANKPANVSEVDWLVQRLVGLLPATPGALPSSAPQRQSLADVVNALVSEFFLAAPTVFVQTNANGQPVRDGDGNLVFRDEWFDLAESFASVMAAATREGLAAAWDSFNPIFVANARLTPTVFGIPFGDAQGFDIRITKDGFSFGGNTTLNTIIAALNPGGPIVGALQGLLNLTDIEFDVEFALSGVDGLFRTVIAGDGLPDFDLDLDVSGKILGTITFLGFDLVAASGLIVSPRSPLLLFPSEDAVSNGDLLRVYKLPNGGVDPATGSITIPPALAGLIPIATEEDYEALRLYGGLLLTGQLFTPLMLADPVKLFADGLAMTQFGAQGVFTPPADLLAHGAAYVERVRQHVLQNREMARFQVYVPSPDRLIFPGPNGEPPATPAELLDAGYARGFLTSKLLSVPLGTATMQLTSDGLEVDARLPWLLGVNASFVLGRRSIGLNGLVENFAEKFGFAGLNLSHVPPVSVDVPFASLRVGLNSADLADLIEDTFGLPAALTPGSGTASLALYSPAFADPLDEDAPLFQRVGGLALDATLDIDQFIENARFHFDAPLFSGTVLPSFHALASVDRIRVPGLGLVANDILDARLTVEITSEDDDLDVSIDGSLKVLRLIDAGLSGTLHVGDDGIAGRFDLTDSTGNSDFVIDAGFFQLSGTFAMLVNTTGREVNGIPADPLFLLRAGARLSVFGGIEVEDDRTYNGVVLSGSVGMSFTKDTIVVTSGVDLLADFPFPLPSFGEDTDDDGIPDRGIGADATFTLVTNTDLDGGRSSIVGGTFSVHTPLGDATFTFDRFGAINDFLAIPFVGSTEQHVFVDDQRFTETDGTASRDIVVSLSRAAERDVEIRYRLVPGSALRNSDFDDNGGAFGNQGLLVTIPEGARSVTISFDVIGDLIGEGDERFRFSIVSARYVPRNQDDNSLPPLRQPDGGAWITIVDDDPRDVVVNFAPTGAVAGSVVDDGEGRLVFRGALTEGGIGGIRLSALNLSAQDRVVVRYRLVPLDPSLRTATPGDDFFAGSGGQGFEGLITLVGSAPRDLNITAPQDFVYELNEEFELVFELVEASRNAPSTALSAAGARVAVTNDDFDMPGGTLVFYDFDEFLKFGGGHHFTPAPTYVDPLVVASDFRHSGETPPVPGASTQLANSALRFGGGIDHAVAFANSSFALPTSAFTVDFWIRPERFDGTSTVLSLGGAFDGGPAGLSVFLDHTAPLQRLVRYRMRNTAGQDFVGTFGSFRFDQWQHVTLVYGGGAAGVSGFVNGASSGGGAGSGAVAYAGQSLTVGAAAGLFQENYLGAIDELRVWTSALGASQVATLPALNTTGAEPILLINYRFDEGSGGTATNATGKGWNARLGSGAGIFGFFGRPDWVVPNGSPVNAFPRYATASSGVLQGVPKVPPVSPTADPSFAVTSSLWSPAGTDITQARYYTFGVGRDVPTIGGVADFRQMLALRFDGIDFFERAAVGGPTRWELRSSRDSFEEVLAEGTTSPSGDFQHHRVIFEDSIRFSFIHPTEGIEFRLYGLDATGNGSWRIDNFALIAGVVQPGVFNLPPVLPPFSFAVDLGGSAAVDPIDRTTDANGDPVDVVGVSVPAGAGSVVRSGNVFVFTPAVGAAGSVPLTFTVADRWGATVTMVVTAQVRGNALDDAFTTLEDTTLNGSVLGNDMRPAGQSVTVAPAEALPSSVTLRADGTFTFVPPPNSIAPVSFVYRLSGPGWSDTARVTITITPVNDLPVAVNRTFTVAEDGILFVAAPGVLANVNDPDGDLLTAVLVSGVSRGTLTFNANGSFTYIPRANDDTGDSFTYAIRDAAGQSNTARVDIDILPVNDLPVAVDRGFTTNEDTTLGVAAPGVLGGVTDVEGGTLRAVLVSGPARGTLTLNPDGSFTYVPRANDDTSDSFSYAISDGSGQGNTARVTIDLLPVNDLPVAPDRTYTVPEDTVLNVAAPGVLAGVDDPEGKGLKAELITTTTRGSLLFNADGSFSYRPRSNDDTSDSFTYLIGDGTGVSNTARVTIDLLPVNDAPVARTDSFTLDTNTTLTVAAPGVLGNDTDVESPTTALKSLLVTGVSHGTLTLNSNGSFTYRPTTSYSGPDGFTYRATDGDAQSTVVSVSLTVRAVNQAPTPANDARPAVSESTTTTPTTVTFTIGNILANDTDPEGSPLTVVSVGPPATGLGTVLASGGLGSGTTVITYTAPGPNFNGTVSIPYTVQDAAGATATASVIVTINPTNDAPVAVNDSGIPYTLNVSNSNVLTVQGPGVLGNDSDPDQNALTAVIATQPVHGQVTLNTNGGFTYTFDGSTFRGNDPFTYRARDPSGLLSAPATVSVTINSFQGPGTGVGGVVTTTNGYVAYGRLGFDANNNHVWDFTDLNGNGVRDFGEPAEPVADMNRGGLTSLFVPPSADRNGNGAIDPEEGVLLAFNGTVTATLQPLVAPLTAPAGSALLTPFTTILAALMADRGLVAGPAQEALRAAFGLGAIDFMTSDPIALARSGGAGGAAYLAAHVRLVNTYAQAAVWLAAHSGLAVPQVSARMASAIAARVADGAPLDLTEGGQVAALLAALVQRAAAAVPEESVSAVAAVIAAGNTLVPSAPGAATAAGRAAFVEAVYRAEAAAQGPVLDSIIRFAVGDLSAAELLAGATGPALTGLVASAKIGPVAPLATGGATLRNLAATPAVEGGATRLTGTVDGAPRRGRITLRINWDDGAVQDVTLPAGATSFMVDHVYGDESPLRVAQDVRRVAVVLSVDGVASDVASVGATVSNAAPVLMSTVLTPMIVVGGTATLASVFSDLGLFDRVSADLDWGDGTSERVDLGVGSRQMSGSHVYGQTGRFTVTLTVSDADGGRAVHTLPLEVVAPVTPAVTRFVVDDGSQQRSMVREFTAIFNQPVDLEITQVTLLRLGGGPDHVVTAANPSGDGVTWQLRFFGPGTIGSSLPDGQYELRIPAGAAVGALGTRMATDFVQRFHRLFGDSDGDRDVDEIDYTRFVRSYRTRRFEPDYVSYFDFDADGDVDNKDAKQIRDRRR